MKKRGKILRDTNAGSGILIIEGKQHQFTLEGMWTSGEPPKLGMTVDVEFDPDGKIAAVSAVPDSQLAKEKAEAALATARQKSKAAAAMVAAKMPGLINSLNANARHLNPGLAKVGLVVVVGVIGLGVILYGCGSNVQGTYHSDNRFLTLVLKSGGEATITLYGHTDTCTYEVDGDKLTLQCTGEAGRMEFTIHDDGSLGGGFIGALKKEKS